MVNKLKVEVAKHNALFAAWVTDVNVNIFKPKDGLYFDVTYDNASGGSEKRVHSSRVKLPCSHISKHWEKNQEVEVCLSRTDTNPLYDYGWWPATITDIQYDYPTKFCVKLKNPENIVLVTWTCIREANRNRPLENLDKVTLPVPPMYEYLAKRVDVQEQFQNLANIPFCEYAPDKHELKIIYYVSDMTTETVENNYNRCFLDLCHRLSPATDETSAENYCEEFTVPKHLMTYALGQDNTNVERVRSMEGVSKVNIQDNNIFICSKTEKTVKEARRLLDYNDEKIQVPQKFSAILNLDGDEITHSIVKKSGLICINVENDEEGLALENVSFHLVGTNDSIREAQFLIELQQNLWKKMMTHVCGEATAVQTRSIRPVKPSCETVCVDKIVCNPVMWRMNANIQAAKAIQGIQRIDEENNDYSFIFKIFGDNENAVRKAKEILNIEMDVSYDIPQFLVGKVFGDNDLKFKDIRDRSGVALIEVLDSASCPVEGNVIFKFIGHPEEIAKAKDLINAITRDTRCVLPITNLHHRIDKC